MLNKNGFFLDIIKLTFIILLICKTNCKSKEDWKTRVIYQLLTDRFSRTDGSSNSCDVRNYCGGSFRGIINNLDYITGMGFNAIWISPILENTPGSYHGYHMTNLYKINPNFGSEQDLIDLINTCHQKNIWVMIDVVANHVGPIDKNYGRITPFNDASHYHDYCTIDGPDFISNQFKVEVKINFFTKTEL